MGFEEWWASFWEPSESFASVNLKDIARAAWEAAQAQDKDVASEIKALWAEYPSLHDEFAMAALTGLLANSDLIGEVEDYARWAYQHADAMLKERER